MNVEDTIGLWIGFDEDHLTELKQRSFDDVGQAIGVESDTVDLNMTSEWNITGTYLIRQIDPVPATILAVTPAGFISGG